MHGSCRSGAPPLVDLLRSLSVGNAICGREQNLSIARIPDVGAPVHAALDSERCTAETSKRGRRWMEWKRRGGGRTPSAPSIS